MQSNLNIPNRPDDLARGRPERPSETAGRSRPTDSKSRERTAVVDDKFKAAPSLDKQASGSSAVNKSNVPADVKASAKKLNEFLTKHKVEDLGKVVNFNMELGVRTVELYDFLNFLEGKSIGLSKTESMAFAA